MDELNKEKNVDKKYYIKISYWINLSTDGRRLRDVRRLGLFVFYEKDGIVDEFIEYFLKDLIKNIDELVIVCNGKISPNGEKVFRQVSSKLIFRENKDYDLGAIRDSFLKYLDRDYILQYDEMILCNSTFFGPLYPLKDVFKEMERQSVDFWGLTKHGKTEEYPEHLQSYFLVIRKKLLSSEDFYDFWRSRSLHLDSIDEVIKNFEVAFTSFFSNKGYSWTAYVKDIECKGEKEKNYNQYINIPYTLVAEQKMPVIKIKSFLHKNILGMSNEEIPILLKYIKEKTTYDIDLILRYLIRTNDAIMLKNMLSLNYVIPEEIDFGYDSANIAVFIYARSKNFLEKCLERLSGIEVPVYLALREVESSNLEGIEDINYNILWVHNETSSTDVLTFFSKNYFSLYEYFCFVSEDAITISSFEKKLIDRSKFENILGNQEYLKSICGIFRKNPYLGFLFIPAAPYLQKFGRDYQSWIKNRETVRYLKDVFDCHFDVDEGAKSFSDLSAFCGRTLLAKQLFSKDFTIDGIRNTDELDAIIGKFLIYLGQKEGYFSGSIYNKNYLPNYIENMSNIILGMQQHMLESNIKRHYNMIDFAKECNLLYLYGAGKVAHSIKSVLEAENVQILGMVVSDEQFMFNKKNSPDEQIISLSQALEIKENIGIIVALNYKNSLEIAPCLQSKGFKNLFYLHDGL